MSTYPRRSAEFTAQMALITETAKKGGPFLRSAHAMEKRLRATVVEACLAAHIQLQHQWMRVEDMVADLAAAEEASPEATFRRILAGEQDAEAAKLEAKGGPRRLNRAETLRESARLHRIQADQIDPPAPTFSVSPAAEAVIEEIAAGLPTEQYFVAEPVPGKGYRIFDRKAGCYVSDIQGYHFEEDAEEQAAAMNEALKPEPVDPRSWEAVRQTPAFAVALDIARQERRAQVKLDQARAKLALAAGLVDQDDAAEEFTTVNRFFRNDNNVLWGAARMLAAMVDNDDESGALSVLRDELDRQDGTGGPVSYSKHGPFRNSL